MKADVITLDAGAAFGDACGVDVALEPHEVGQRGQASRILVALGGELVLGEVDASLGKLERGRARV